MKSAERVDGPPPDLDPSAQTLGTRADRHRRRWLRRNLRWIALALVIMLAPVGWSYGRALTAPGNENWSTRTVEWIKHHGGRGLVIAIEDWWYSHHKPPVGGEPSGGIPIVEPQTPTPGPTASVSPLPTGPPHLEPPPDIRPIATPPLANEGHWQPLGRRVSHIPTMYVAYVRPDTVHTSLLTTVVWMDTKLVHPVLYAGTQDPGGSNWRHYAQIGKGDLPDLVAAFNSGFQLKDTPGGWFSEGKFGKALVNGGATLVIYKDGTVDVGAWGRDVRMSPEVASARQNLSLIVRGGKPIPGLAKQDFRNWGATYGGDVLVWRSGVGVTADGGLLYAAGDGLSAFSLANILARAGAVRAMEMDINHTWMSFDWFKPAPGRPFGLAATKMLDNQYRTAYRYLTPDERDFLAVFLRPSVVATEAPASPLSP